MSTISLPVCLLLVYRKDTRFPKLILYCATSLKLMVASGSFLVVFWEFLMSDIISSANRDNLTSFPICIPLISFSCLIVPSNASSTVLKRSGDCGQPCLIFYFNGISLSFSSFKIMLAVSLSYTAFIMLKYVHSSLVFSRTFIMKAYWIFFSQTLFFIYLDGHVISLLSLLVWFIVFTDLGILSLPEILG